MPNYCDDCGHPIPNGSSCIVCASEKGSPMPDNPTPSYCSFCKRTLAPGSSVCLTNYAAADCAGMLAQEKAPMSDNHTPLRDEELAALQNLYASGPYHGGAGGNTPGD